MDKSITVPEITLFEDYRDFLKERFIYEKSRRRSFSFQLCGNQLGTSKVYLKLVIEKKRHISLAKISALWKLFQMTEFEQQYFTLLFLKATSEQKDLRIYFDTILATLRSRVRHVPDNESKSTDAKKEGVFNGWLNMAIHSLAKFEDFQPTVEWIQGKLAGSSATRAKIEKAIHELKEIKSIQKIDNRWVPSDFVFKTPATFDLENFKIYKIGLNRVSEVLDDLGQHRPSNFHMMSIGLNEQDENEVFKLFTEFRDKAIAISKKGTGKKKVFLISNNIVALTK